MSTWRDSKIGLPLSSVSSSANSSIFFSSRSASFQIRRPRSLADIFRQGPFRSSRARRAAATARSTSAEEPSAICVNTSPVAGLRVSNFFAPSTHCPSMSNCPGSIFTLAASIHRPVVRLVAPASRRLSGERPRPPRSALALFRLERCRALLHICSQSLFRVVALKENLLVFALNRQRGLHRNFPSRLHRALDPPHSLGSFIGRTELLGVLHHVFHEAVALVDVVDDSELQRFFKRERVAGNHQLDRFALAHEPREPLGAASAGKHAEIHFRQTDLARVFSGDANVSSHGNLEAAAH